jgi:hypothetical protein
MIDLLIDLGNAFALFWWVVPICGLLLVIIAHLPNVKDFHWWDIKLPVIAFAVWAILYLLVRYECLTI